MAVRNVVVGVVYKKDGNLDSTRFLVLHRVFLWTGWEFPKGGVEKSDASDESAMMRELQEETGLVNARITTKLPYEIRYKYPKKYSDNYKFSETVQSVFLIRSFTDAVEIPDALPGGSKEHSDFKWLPYKEARNLLTHDQQKKALDIAWKHIDSMEKKEE
jgi:8-oxo-dGTP pyrophosphatase MutT (NUDIX family)